MSLIDLSQLPAPNVIEPLDFEAILTAMKAHLIALSPHLEARINLESDPVVKLLEVCAYRELVLRYRINEAAKSVMLPYASGSDLENLGALVGVERLLNESDKDFRRRILLSYSQYSTAGSRESYIFHTLSASDEVRDAAVWSDEPGLVEIVVLGKNGEVNSDVLTQVINATTGETVRPLCDTVLVYSAEMVGVPVIATLYIGQGPDSGLVHSVVKGALYDYFANLKIGESVYLTKLHAILHADGVVRVDLQLIHDVLIERHQAAYASQIALNIEII